MEVAPLSSGENPSGVADKHPAGDRDDCDDDDDRDDRDDDWYVITLIIYR